MFWVHGKVQSRRHSSERWLVGASGAPSPTSVSVKTRSVIKVGPRGAAGLSPGCSGGPARGHDLVERRCSGCTAKCRAGGTRRQRWLVGASGAPSPTSVSVKTRSVIRVGPRGAAGLSPGCSGGPARGPDLVERRCSGCTAKCRAGGTRRRGGSWGPAALRPPRALA